MAKKTQTSNTFPTTVYNSKHLSWPNNNNTLVSRSLERFSAVRRKEGGNRRRYARMVFNARRKKLHPPDILCVFQSLYSYICLCSRQPHIHQSPNHIHGPIFAGRRVSWSYFYFSIRLSLSTCKRLFCMCLWCLCVSVRTPKKRQIPFYSHARLCAAYLGPPPRVGVRATALTCFRRKAAFLREHGVWLAWHSIFFPPTTPFHAPGLLARLVFRTPRVWKWVYVAAAVGVLC